MQHLLWASAWLQSVAAELRSSPTGKKAKDALGADKSSVGNGGIGAEDVKISPKPKSALTALQAVTGLQKCVTDAVTQIQVQTYCEVTC